MITREQALALRSGTLLHAGTCTRLTGPRGGVRVRQEVWRVSGQCKTWVTRPEAFSVPIKFGLYASSYLTHANAANLHLADDCPLNHE